MLFSVNQLKQLLAKYQIPFTDEAVQSLRTHAALLKEANDDKDLTRLVNAQDILIKHYLDCAIVLKYLKLPSPLLDIGTGAGFPGIVLKILSPETEIILGEPRHKRTTFIKKCIQTLGLTGVSVFEHRIGPGFSLPVQGIITRALESIPETLKRASYFLPQGGKVIFMKGPSAGSEAEEANSLYHSTFNCDKIHNYTLEGPGNKRSLYVYTRTKEELSGTQNTRYSTSVKKMNLREITSPANADFTLWKKLSDSREIKKNGLFLVSGEKIITEILALPQKPEIRAVIFRAEHITQKWHEQINHAYSNVLSDKLYKELDFSNTGSPILVCRNPEWTVFDGTLAPPLDVFLPFQDPGNIGTAIRTCSAMGLSRVIVLKEAANPYHPKSVRAGGSALFRVQICRGPSLPELCDSIRSTEIYLSDNKGMDIQSVDSKPKGLIFGLEGKGFSGIKTQLPACKIPMKNEVESLNAASALAMMLYAVLSKQ